MRFFLFSVFVGWAFVAAEEDRGMYDEDLFEGDINLTPEQQEELSIGRGSLTTALWPGGIVPYSIDDSISQRCHQVIQAGMKLWSDSTCIRFRKRTKERAYIHFTHGIGCSSTTGRTGYKQNIYLAGSCKRSRVAVSHEVGHALGFFHEQARPDRDQYVEILTHNIKKGMEWNFNINNAIDSLGTTYDYSSVMHYTNKAFSKNRLPTIRAKGGYRRLGNRSGPSKTDLMQMDLLYEVECSRGDGELDILDICEDNHRDCSKWSKLCTLPAYEYVREHCKQTCNLC